MTSCLPVLIKSSRDCCALAAAACRVVDSLRHSEAEYRVTSRELGYTGSAQ